uniref:Uncharacterized protein n=1 Tax=Davidia involucrata TaxID=16924 RepID=A0A5B7B824_DAVIN
MMDSSERPHRTGSTSSSSSELFVCFTSRLSSSSSSMKLSSKSILSPGRTRDPPPAVSLSNSLSRRLRSNGSMKGGQASPMFPTGTKKRGCGFDNAEPSSPKVTCIGQVRVKTKKQGKKMRTLSKRRGGEVSFRKAAEQTGREGVVLNQSHSQTHQTNANNQYQQQECLPHRNQRWVHLPLTICEALRAFGAEFSCLFPCRSSCFSTSEREKEEKAAGSTESGQSSCGAVFARWLVALQDGEGGKGREIEMVVGRDEEEETTFRRHAVEELEIRDDNSCQVKADEEDEARVSICIPPKNALLLMRCRSDPMRMSALANRFWESPAPPKYEEEDEEEDDDEEDDRDEEELANVVLLHGELKDDQVRMEDKENEQVCEKWVSDEACEEAELVVEVQEENLEIDEELIEEKQEQEVTQLRVVKEEENVLDGSSSHEALVFVDQETVENEEQEPKLIQEEIEERRVSVQLDSEDDENEPEAESLAEEAALEVEEAAEKSTVEKETQEEEKVTQERFEPEEEGKNYEDEEEHTAEPYSEETRESHVERESSVLPDCLLLMMCEPKLSMEVSKETWVCSTDFIRWQPEKQVNPKGGADEPKKRLSTDSTNPAAKHQPLQQPPRSSCSFPAPAPTEVSMATMIEQKLVNAVGYEPFVLTRCKSEPMRSAAKLAPEACFWKNRKLEPLRRATLGVGAAGVGC